MLSPGLGRKECWSDRGLEESRTYRESSQLSSPERVWTFDRLRSFPESETAHMLYIIISEFLG